MKRPEAFLLALALVFGMVGCSRLTFVKPNVSRDDQSLPSVRNAKPDVDNVRAAVTNVALGQKYLRDGDYEVAMEKLQHALKLDPKSVDANTVLGVLNERIGRKEIAGKFYLRATELAPDKGAVLNNYGTWLCANGRVGEADAWFQKALADPFYKTPVVALGNAGTCAVKNGDPGKAEQYFRRALQAQPDNASVLMDLAALQFRQGDYMSARGFIQRGEGSGAVSPRMLELAARIEQQLGDIQAAARYRQRLATEFPDYQSRSAVDPSASIDAQPAAKPQESPPP